MSGVFDPVDANERDATTETVAQQALGATAAAGAFACLIVTLVVGVLGRVSPAALLFVWIVASGLVGTFWFVQRRDLERRLGRLRADQTAESIEAVGRLSASLAHELRNPLAALKGNMQLLAAGMPAESEHREEASLLVEDVLRLERRIEGVLRFVRSGRVDPQVCDVPEILSAIVTRVGDVRLRLDLSEAPASWSVDRAGLETVLENLVHNALQASDEGGPVDLTASASERALTIRVADRGKGLPPGDTAELFEPFVTRRDGGTGLGLAIARQIVLAHRGHIVARRRDGGGTVFSIEIPNG